MSVTLTLRRTKSGTRARRTCDDSERPGHVTTGLNHGGHMARPRVPLTGCSVRLIQPYDDAIEKTVSDFYEEFLRFTTVVGRTRGTYTDNREFYDFAQFHAAQGTLGLPPEARAPRELVLTSVRAVLYVELAKKQGK